MCGIFGIISNKRNLTKFLGPATLAIDALHHRGPDDRGIICKRHAILGHTRLSIIDLKHGKQPMTSHDRNLIITFNGEIYNYRELRDDLQKKGFEFKTCSDTEVILVAYQYYREKCLDLFQGMFAFAIFNVDTGEIFAARDRFGIKPFYYTIINDLFIFSSEIRPIYKTGLVPFEPNPEHFNEFLIFGYIAGEETLHHHVKELNPAHYLTLKTDNLNIQKYWYPFESGGSISDSIEEIIPQLECHIQKAVRLWTAGDVEVASFLSGGIDSSIISKLASDIFPSFQTITASFPKNSEIDELNLATHLIKQIQGSSRIIPFDDAYLLDNLERLANHLDDPIMTPGDYTLMGLCEGLRSQSNLKVVLCGEGGDELFGGYDRYKLIPEKYSQSKDDNILLYAMNKIAISRLRLFSESTKISNPYRQKLVKNLQSENPLSKMLELDQLTYLTTRLQSQDRIGMMFGFEIRPPFLEHVLTEYVNKLPNDLKIRDGYNKWILRKIASNHIPKKVAWEKAKKGLPSDALRMFNHGKLKTKFSQLISPQSKIASYYSVKGMHKLLKNHSIQENHSNTLFRLLSLELWLNSCNSYPKS